MSTSAEPGVAQIRSTIEERPAWTGGIGLAAGAIVVTLALVFAGMMVIGIGVESDNGALGALAVVLIILAVLVASGLGMISPGHTRVVQFFGQYIGTVRHTGLVYTVPLTTRRNVSVRVRNFETSELKVNDAEGNPVNIAAIVVWQVADTA
jgi:regulator of protease activity HflC (stomatin/prohibitin superfamily)